MATGNQQRRLRFLDGILAFTALASISQVQASIFGRSEFYNAAYARGVSSPQEPVLLSGLYPRGPNVGGSSPMESSWRYTGGGSGPNAGIDLGLFRRQNGDVEAYCNQGMHVCRAFDGVGCCNNNAYCIITKQGQGRCCPLGTVCAEDPCKMTSTYCTQVMTVTGNPSASATGVAVTTSTGCCVRACSYTMHLCDLKFGGYCCGNNAVCLPNKLCQPTPNANMPTTTIPTKVTITKQQCSTGSFACAAAVGGGCCPNNMVCTDVSSTPACALSDTEVVSRVLVTATNSANGLYTDKPTNVPSLTGTANGASNTGGISSPSDSSSSSTDLSAGAKAGIGIGAAVAVLAFIALGAFFFIRHKKKNAAVNTVPPPPPPPQEMGHYGGYGAYGGYGGVQGQQGPYYEYPQGYNPAPQASPQMTPSQGYYEPPKPQSPLGYGEGGLPLPRTDHPTAPTAELPAQ